MVWGFSTSIKTDPGSLYNMYLVSFPGLKGLVSGIDHPPLYRSKVEERVEVYLYSPSGPYGLF
jgi:hypothetical protein